MKEYTIRIKEKYEGHYAAIYYAVQRKYWIFWITVENFSSIEDACKFDYCKYLEVKALKKDHRRLLEWPTKVYCKCSEERSKNGQ